MLAGAPLSMLSSVDREMMHRAFLAGVRATKASVERLIGGSASAMLPISTAPAIIGRSSFQQEISPIAAGRGDGAGLGEVNSPASAALLALAAGSASAESPAV